jgi:predicted nucleic acid-binding protein
MSSQPVVADSSPLIALIQIHHIDLLPTLFGAIVTPPAVQHETRTSVPRPDWLIERALTRTVDPRVPSSLHAGEREAISLALELNSSTRCT